MHEVRGLRLWTDLGPCVEGDLRVHLYRGGGESTEEVIGMTVVSETLAGDRGQKVAVGNQ